jgi:hypothetical protein
MSELEAPSNTPSMVETRMMETGETVGTDGVAIGTLTTANFTGSADRLVGSVDRSEPLRISLVR